jgi:hypothetical protein
MTSNRLLKLIAVATLALNAVSALCVAPEGAEKPVTNSPSHSSDHGFQGTPGHAHAPR